MWYYPPFEPRLWILYEIAEFHLTCDGPVLLTPDIEEFATHIDEMVRHGVRHVLENHDYRCTNEYDRAFLTCWLELLVLMKQLRVNVLDTRQLLEHMTWSHTCEDIVLYSESGNLRLNKFKGTLIFGNKRGSFTPFPAIFAIPGRCKE
jgi:hypothetical protein